MQSVLQQSLTSFALLRAVPVLAADCQGLIVCTDFHSDPFYSTSLHLSAFVVLCPYAVEVKDASSAIICCLCSPEIETRMHHLLLMQS